MRMLSRCLHLNSLHVLSGGYWRRIYNGKDRQTGRNDLLLPSDKACGLSCAVNGVLGWESHLFVRKASWFGSVSL